MAGTAAPQQGQEIRAVISELFSRSRSEKGRRGRGAAAWQHCPCLLALAGVVWGISEEHL